MTRWEQPSPSKYKNERVWSKVCERFFASKLERQRGEELHWLEKAGEIKDLKYQVSLVLSNVPGHKVTKVIDFSYEPVKLGWLGITVYEDAKGKMTAEERVKLAWVKDKFGIDVILYKKESEEQKLLALAESQAGQVR